MQIDSSLREQLTKRCGKYLQNNGIWKMDNQNSANDVSLDTGSYIDEIFKLESTVNSSMVALAYLFKSVKDPKIDQLIRTTNVIDPMLFDYAQTLFQRNKYENFLKDEFKSGFPYLFGLVSIRLWSILESYVDDFAIDLIRDNPEIHKMDSILRLKGPLVQYLNASDVEQAEILLNLLKESAKSNLKQGVGRFEIILESIGLGGEVNKEIRNILFELSQIRNVLVHRNGKADLRFINMCPWLDYRLNDEIHVSGTSFQKYKYAAIFYMLDINIRSIIRYPPVDKDKFASDDTLREIQIMILKILAEKKY